jgi:hypothetical protein
MLWSSTSAAGGGGPLPRLVRIRQRFVRTGSLTNRSGAVGRRLSRVVNGSSVAHSRRSRLQMKNIAELKAGGAVVIDPIVIPNLKLLLAKGASNPNNFEAGLKVYLARNPRNRWG